MNKQQKEVLQSQLNSEEEVIKELKKTYKKALEDCKTKIELLSARAELNPDNLQSIIYQKNFQEAIKAQLEGVLVAMDSDVYATISEYLNKCYEEGYVGVMYDLASQGIPLVMPIDPKDVMKAVQTDSQLSSGLYKRLGEDVKVLKKAVSAELSRGIANGYTWNQTAANLARNFKNTPFNKAYNNSIRIARTEGHRVQTQSALDAQHKAKAKGADIVKQWDASLDGRTRTTHRQLDGQIREIDEPFEVGGMKADAPGMFGNPAEDCNCRCALLQRAKWALDEEELETLKQRAEYFGLDKTDSFDDYKKKYLKISQDDIKGADSGSVRSDAQKMNDKSTSKEKAQDDNQQLEDEALEWYVSGDGMWINQYLRGNGDFGELSSQEKMLIDAIDKATRSEIVKENVLYRSVDANVVFGNITDIQYNAIYDALKYNDPYAKKQADRLIEGTLGKEITEKGFMSTTKSEEFAFDFGDFTGSEKPMVIKFNVPDGIKGKDLAKFDIEGDEQYEVLLAKNQKYKITNITAKDGNIIVEADLITINDKKKK